MDKKENVGLNEEILNNAEDQVKKIEKLLSKAYEEAEKNGKLIGRISRYGEVRVEENSEVDFIIDPSTYYSENDAPFHKVGDYLVAIDPKDMRLVLIRIKSIIRKDELAAIGLEPPISQIVNSIEPRGLITNTIVKGELVLEINKNDKNPRPATKSIEPQSPVIDPDPEVLARLLDLPQEGITIGALSTPSGLVKNGQIPVKLPLHTVYHHILILGTTGSGKTTLLKNMIASMYNQLEKHPISIIIDSNQDFVQLPISNNIKPIPEEILNSCYKNVKELDGIISVVPISFDLIQQKFEKEREGINEVLIDIAKKYFNETFSPFIQNNKVDFNLIVRDNTIILKTDYPFKLIFVPYVINTLETSTDNLSPLLPGITLLAKDLLKKMRENFKRKHKVYPPIQAIYGALSVFMDKSIYKLNKNNYGLKLDDILEQALEYINPYIVSISRDFNLDLHNMKIGNYNLTLFDAVEEYIESLQRARPHEETIKALYRRISSLIESQIVDIIIPQNNKLIPLNEPNWETIVNIANEENIPIVLDLKWNLDLIGLDPLRLVTYRTLDKLISWKQKSWTQRNETPNIMVVIDEAHQFFQNESKVKEDVDAIRQVSAMISKIARLGRARGVGLIFSTHSPADLNDIILQLTNTKIILRTDKSQIERISIPKEVNEYLSRLQDRTMLVESYAFRMGYLFAQTTTPLTAHYDISANISYY
ncbi:putative ATPase [Caldisphaera lagunensis DSM 15908]|uniref:Putative ATPase n=1 Tax=Caldisphaera lagunensis (strain DSM 15908 / JCM 11604 / ANMR 0165 / IC-154) TaxID=1056495 RepID=L0AA34_CALLD|nr:ATP-binding protein [Caldisphaera lagunensis]AFZ69987.1 putative ATPase [Caldisphaera lagunensis DSM 15908]